MKCKKCSNRSNACESCKEMKELIALITSMLHENEKVQGKILNLIREPVGLHIEQGMKLFEILGNMNSLGQNLEEEGMKILQQLKCKEGGSISSRAEN